MPVQSYDRPVAHPTISTPINVGFAGSLQAVCPNFFSLLTTQARFSHHDVIVVGDETFQFVDPLISNAVTNDTYIAVFKSDPAADGDDVRALGWALGRVTPAQEATLVGFAPTLTDTVTPARTVSAHSLIVKYIAWPTQSVVRAIAMQRELVFQDAEANDNVVPALHDLLVIGPDTYEALDSSSVTNADRTLSDDTYFPWDISGVDVDSVFIDLQSTINGTRVGWSGSGFLKVDGTTPVPVKNGTAHVLCTVNVVYNSVGMSMVIEDADAPGGTSCLGATQLMVTLPMSLAFLAIKNTFGATVTTSLTIGSVGVWGLVVFNGQGTLGPKSLGGDQVMQSGAVHLPPGLSNNHAVYFDQPFSVDMAAISRLADSGSTLTFYIEADADERDDVDNIGHLFRVDFTPDLSNNGGISLDTTVTPMRGTGVDSPEPFPTLIVVPHEENMDTWQTEMNRPRQDISQQVIVDDDQLLNFGNVIAQ